MLSLQLCLALVTLWTIAYKAPLSMGFSKQEYWSGLSSPPPGDLPNPGIEPGSLISLALAGRFFTTSTTLDLKLNAQFSCRQILNMFGILVFSSIQSLSHAWLFATSWTAAHQAYHQLLEFTQTHDHWVSDAIQPSHSLLNTSLSAFNLSQHQGLFKWVSTSHQVAKVLEFQLQHQSFQWTARTDLL